MNQENIRRVLIGISIVCVAALSGCGGEEEKTAAKAEAPAAAPAPVNNPLAKQQAAMKDAAAVQGLFDKNADAKKKALEDAMN